MCGRLIAKIFFHFKVYLRIIFYTAESIHILSEVQKKIREKTITGLKLRNHSTAIFGLSSKVKSKLDFLKILWNVEQYSCNDGLICVVMRGIKLCYRI